MAVAVYKAATMIVDLRSVPLSVCKEEDFASGSPDWAEGGFTLLILKSFAED